MDYSDHGLFTFAHKFGNANTSRRVDNLEFNSRSNPAFGLRAIYIDSQNYGLVATVWTFDQHYFCILSKYYELLSTSVSLLSGSLQRAMADQNLLKDSFHPFQ